ncbi:MAG: thymidine phosphorylase [Hyphomicrobiales bacterium]|nr:thymidine phosphorylase [Hyphomicrobiales bacterium]
MQPGIFFYIVGASGVGKDTLISGALQRLSGTERYTQVRRVITRPAGPGEDHEPATAASFARQLERGRFLHHWQAHGLDYGIPAGVRDDLAKGYNVIANGSRAALKHLVGKVHPIVVVEITAPRDNLRRRLIERGRETEAEIDARLTREVEACPQGVDVVRVSNDSTVEAGVAKLVRALEHRAGRLALRRLPIHSGRYNKAFLPADSRLANALTLSDSVVELIGGDCRLRAEVTLMESGWQLCPEEIGVSVETFDRMRMSEGAPIVIQRAPAPLSQPLIRKKMRGDALDAKEYACIFEDVLRNAYSDREISPFLLRVIENCAGEELIAIARARARLMPRIEWPGSIIVDKHSLGGTPGNRLTLVVVPIVAAHGMLMPKTSSRAITSAAGTADVMEAASKIDLTRDDVKRVVEQTGGCIAWNGRLNHSALDDIVNALTLPLGLDANRWSVASIMSKKWSAGSTHVVMDLPYGAEAKVKDLQAASELARLFESVGAGLGLNVRPIITESSALVGQGIGPALELRDVLAVLSQDQTLAGSLREKALLFAGTILAFDPSIKTYEAGRARAEALLASGAALAKFDQIVDAQGRVEFSRPGLCTFDVRAEITGMVHAMNMRQLTSVARAAGAPADKSGGIDVAVRVGDTVHSGELLYRIHASCAANLTQAVTASGDTGIQIKPVKPI